MTRRRVLFGVGFGIIALLIGLTARYIVWPDTDPAPKRADAVVVLGGGGEERLDTGLRLMRKGVAPVLLISDGERQGWKEANAL